MNGWCQFQHAWSLVFGLGRAFESYVPERLGEIDDIGNDAPELPLALTFSTTVSE